MMDDPTKLTTDQLIHQNYELFSELEFWKSTALESTEVSEDAYEKLCEDVEYMMWEMDPMDTGMIHG
jgi:hypothetical protein